VPVPKLTEDEWEELTERLTLYAYGKLARLYWRGLPLRAGGSVPGGVVAEDLAAEAITDTIQGTRVWNPQDDSDFPAFLRSVVDSKVSHLAKSLENRLSRRSPAAQTDDDPPIEQLVRDPRGDPQTVHGNQEAADNFRAMIRAEILGDDLAEGILNCLEQQITKPSEMAVLLDVTVEEINNAQKRLRRKVEKMMKAKGRKV